jgi:hypothetical protein
MTGARCTGPRFESNLAKPSSDKSRIVRVAALPLARHLIPSDHLLIRIEPPLIGQGFGMGDKDLDQLVIGARSGMSDGLLSGLSNTRLSYE